MSQVIACDCTRQYSDRTEIINVKEKIELPAEKDDRLIFSIEMKDKNGHSVEHVSIAYVCERVLKLANAYLNQIKEKESRKSWHN
jgi:hypothetical protein